MSWKRHCFIIGILYSLFLLVLFIQKPFSFNYNRNPKEIAANYLRSQDIYDPEGLIKDRLIISDSDIYLGSGYLYSLGENPVEYNFQHPPLIKYIYGYAIKFFNNPYIAQFLFSLSVVYFFQSWK